MRQNSLIIVSVKIFMYGIKRRNFIKEGINNFILLNKLFILDGS